METHLILLDYPYHRASLVHKIHNHHHGHLYLLCHPVDHANLDIQAIHDVLVIRQLPVVLSKRTKFLIIFNGQCVGIFSVREFG